MLMLRNRLVVSPPVAFIQDYYSCVSTTFQAMLNAAGIAQVSKISMKK